MSFSLKGNGLSTYKVLGGKKKYLNDMTEDTKSGVQLIDLHVSVGIYPQLSGYQLILEN